MQIGTLLAIDIIIIFTLHSYAQLPQRSGFVWFMILWMWVLQCCVWQKENVCFDIHLSVDM